MDHERNKQELSGRKILDFHTHIDTKTHSAKMLQLTHVKLEEHLRFSHSKDILENSHKKKIETLKTQALNHEDT